MSIMQIIVSVLILLVKLIIALSISSCVKKIFDDIESMRTQHYHSFNYYNENYLAE